MVTKLQSQIPYIQDELPIHIPMFFYAVHPFDIHTAFEGHFVKMGDQRLMQKPIWAVLSGSLNIFWGEPMNHYLCRRGDEWLTSTPSTRSSSCLSRVEPGPPPPCQRAVGSSPPPQPLSRDLQLVVEVVVVTRTPCSTWRLEERVSGMERRLLGRDTSTCRFNRASTGEDSLWSSSRGGNNFQPFHLSLTWFYISTLRYGIHPPAGVEDAANCFYQGKSAFLAFCQKSNLAH